MNHELTNIGPFRYEPVSIESHTGEHNTSMEIRVDLGGNSRVLLADVYLEYSEDGEVVLYVWDEHQVFVGDPTRIVLIRHVGDAIEKALEDTDV